MPALTVCWVLAYTVLVSGQPMTLDTKPMSRGAAVSRAAEIVDEYKDKQPWVRLERLSIQEAQCLTKKGRGAQAVDDDDD